MAVSACRCPEERPGRSTGLLYSTIRETAMKLFDFLFAGAIDRRVAAFQNDLITRHCDEVDNIYRKMRGWRHDYHNHIQTLLALTEDPEALRKYLWELNDDLTTVDTVLKTGNVMVDAILNSKLSLIKSRDISVNAKATVPAQLAISEIDLCAILGNLLDNAFDAMNEGADFKRQKELMFGIYSKPGAVLICVDDTGSGIKSENLNRIFENGYSTKGEGRGVGLYQIKAMVESCGGTISVESQEGVGSSFTVSFAREEKNV